MVLCVHSTTDSIGTVQMMMIAQLQSPGAHSSSSSSSSSFGWEVAWYIMLLLLLWSVVRFIATYFTSAVQYLFHHLHAIKVDPYINGVKYPVSYWSEQGGRPYQEDRYQTVKGSGAVDSSLYGVFDGHGGYRASQYCREYLLKCIINDTDFEELPAKALFRSFFKVDAEFSAKAKIQMLTDGTTAVVAVIHDGKIFVGNAGDSRAILVQKGGKAKAMSVDHRPDRKDEEERIRKLGGTVKHWGRWRVEGILAVSRSIGDVVLQPYITCEPEIVERQIESVDEFLVLASDGLWDVMDNDDVAKLVLRNSRDFINLGKLLCTEAIMMGSTDNVTALVVDLKQRVRRAPTRK